MPAIERANRGAIPFHSQSPLSSSYYNPPAESMAAPPRDAAASTTPPAARAPAPPGPSSPPPPLPVSPCGLLLVLHHISKKANVRTLITSAAAFGAAVIVVGQPTFRIERDVPSALRPQPAEAAADDANADPTGVSVLRFDGTIEKARDWLHAHGVRLLGVEIAEAGASDVDTEPFTGPTALLLGNEGTGMSQRQMRACDGFVYIAQFGTGTASLNVAVAGSVVMHRYALWHERQGEGKKGEGGMVGGESMPVEELKGDPTGDCDS